MKKVIITIVVIAILGISYYLSSQKAPSLKEQVVSSDLFKKRTHPQKNIESLFKDHEYRNASILLAKEMKKERLDPKLLDQKSKEMEREEFLSSLPEGVRRAYESLSRAQARLKKGEFPQFKRMTPKWIKERQTELDEVELPQNLKKFVEDKKSWRSISNQDLEYLLQECASDRDCVEKSLKIWTDAGQRLSSGQYALIRKALL